MSGLHRQQAIEGLAYLRVEAGGDPKAADAYYAARDPGFPVVRDPDAAVAKAFAATAIPCFVLVDPFGRIRYRGGFPGAQLPQYMALLRTEKADPGADAPLFNAAVLDASQLLAATRLPDLAGNVKSLKDLRGRRGLLLMFTDTDCPFSVAVVQQVAAMAAGMAGQQVNTVLVNLEDPAPRVQAFFADRKTGTPVVYDVTRATRLNWGIDSVPTVLYIGTAGQVAYNGPAVWAKVAAAAEESMGLKAGTLAPPARGTEFG